MRVLLIDVNCKQSSTGKIVYDLYERLRRDGHEAAVCYGRGPAIDEENIFKFGLDVETYLHAALARLTGINGYFSFLSTCRLIGFIEKFRPDVIHLHELHAYFVNIKMLMKYISSKKIKVVWTFHCEYMYTGKCGHAYECERWKIQCGHCPAVKEYPKSLGLDFTRKMFSDKKKALTSLDFTIVTPSEWLAQRVKQSFLKDKRIFVVHNGIDTDALFYPRSAEETESLRETYGCQNKKIVVSVAPDIMGESKGGKTVVQISRRFPAETTQFVLVGAHENARLGENVTLIQKTADQNELAAWYSVADVFLICSKRENFPTTCLEAVCCGTPVVGFDAGGTKETAPAPIGTFCPPGDIDGICTALQNVMSKPKDTKVVRSFGAEAYSKQKMYEAYIKVYQDCFKTEES